MEKIKKNNSLMVKSPYNFVPAPRESEVFKPDWACQISHDIPFSDGESGEISIKIIAHTPIFIRNGHTEEDAKAGNDRYLSFSHVIRNGEKQYFIPATSLKGMIRTTLEIMTRSRLKPMNNHRYSFRNLKKGSLYLKSYQSNEVKCGWLEKDEEGNWKILDCGKPAHIHHKEVDEALGTEFSTKFLNARANDIKKYKSVREKYNEVSDRASLKNKCFEVKNNNTGKKIATLLSMGLPGTIVFTGQPGPRNEKRKPPSGKVHEFVFFEPEKKRWLDVPKEVQEDFKFIYNDHDKDNISPDWKYWKEKLKEGERVPIFFTPEGGDGVKHLGLSFMYKLPYQHSTHEIFPYNEYSFKEMDFSDVLFGSLEGELPLKGRVFWGHAFSENAEPVGEVEEILATPKASYYPFYLVQFNPKKQEDFKTYQDKDAESRGFKKYPVRLNIVTGDYSVDQKRNKKIFSKFEPIGEGAVFTGKIRFHNLRKFEIGALLSALTFHGHDGLFHSLGGVKPFGYGKVKIEVEFDKRDEYLEAFEQLMLEHDPAWIRSDYLKELFAMASDSSGNEAYLVYPKLEPKNEFKEYKDNCEVLPPYSETHRKPPVIISAIPVNCEEAPTNNWKEFKKFVNHNCRRPVEERFRERFKEIITEIVKNDKASRNKLLKKNRNFEDEYDWHTTLTDWFGEKEAKELYQKLKERFGR